MYLHELKQLIIVLLKAHKPLQPPVSQKINYTFDFLIFPSFKSHLETVHFIEPHVIKELWEIYIRYLTL